MSLPVEVLQFAAAIERAYLESLGATVTMRGGDDTPFVTDEGNWIYDCDFGPIDDPARLSSLLHERAAVVEHGLFLDLATDVLIATDSGVEHRTRS
jgi:ribose 5-phosphate isomerase A